MGFLKLLTASGNTAGAGGRRRSSAASGALGRFVFAHLRILDNVLDLLLRDGPSSTNPAPCDTHLVRECTCLWHRRRWNKHVVTLVRCLITDARQLHAACAKSLEGLVDTVQLAQHSEQARPLAHSWPGH